MGRAAGRLRAPWTAAAAAHGDCARDLLEPSSPKTSASENSPNALATPSCSTSGAPKPSREC
eukprot:3809530-Pyramimonas_sp.AAC.1